MARKAKAKKGKVKNQAAAEKKKELQKFWDSFLSQREEYEAHLHSICNDKCARIRKMYADKLKSLPENIRNMTVIEYMNMQNKVESQSITNDLQAICSQFQKTKLASEKKKTLKKNKTERKRSLSVSVCSGIKGCPPNLLARSSRVLSESCLSTPLSKQSVAPTYVVTPKFNPRVPLSKACLRRPRAGEVLMSLSGSPLQNFVDDIPEKPAVMVSLGGGKVIKITEDTELTKLKDDFEKKLDEHTKLSLANVKQKLERILQS